MAFMKHSGLRLLTPQETGAYSPISVELMSQLRENIEALFLAMYGTGYRFVVNSVDEDDGYKLHVTALEGIRSTVTENILSSLQAVFITGLATSVKLDITHNTPISENGGTATIKVAGGDVPLTTLGVSPGDELLVVHKPDQGSETRGHTHNGVDSPSIAVSGLLAEIADPIEAGMLSTSASFSVEKPLMMRVGQKGVDCRLSLHRPYRLTTTGLKQYLEWAQLNRVECRLYRKKAHQGIEYALDDEGVLRSTVAEDTVYGDTVILTPEQLQQIGQNSPPLGIRIQLPGLDLAQFSMPTGSCYTAGVEVKVFANGSYSGRYVAVSDIRFFSAY